MADLDQINDEDELHALLRKTEDFEERKKIRARMRDLGDAKAAEMDARRRDREQAREDGIKQKHAKAAEAKVKQIEQMREDAREKMLSTKIGSGEAARRDRQVRADQEKKGRLESLQQMNDIKKDIYLTGVGKKDMEEQAVFRSTKTEAGPDGGHSTTHTTTTTQRSQDGNTTVTKQTKQVTKTGGFGGTNVTINKTVAARGGGRGAMGGGAAQPNLLSPGGGGKVTIQRSPSAIKQMLLDWCSNMTKEYKEYGVEITNFSSSWNNGMAFCALIHHFFPKAFDFSKLNPKNRRFNFSLAFDCAEKMGDVAPLLEVDDMVRMKNPDWKCVFTYVQSYYRRFREAPDNAQKAGE